MVDGTLIPVRDRQVGASSRNYRFSPNGQVIIDADTRLVVATARPASGNRADAQLWRNSGLAQPCDRVTVLGDGAYIHTCDRKRAQFPSCPFSLRKESFPCPHSNLLTAAPIA